MTIRLPWMSRADRRRWHTAHTIAELGDLMAQWLEGRIESRPGYQPRYGPDEETAQLVPTLAALCRAGYITTCSQPGFAGTGADGLWWEQRAAVELVVTDPVLLDPLVDAATDAGMILRVHDHRQAATGQDDPVIATTRDGDPMTAFGGRIGRADMAVQWHGINRLLRGQIARGTYVTIVAPEYGPDGDQLWVILDYLTGRRCHDPDSPWQETPVLAPKGE